MLNLALVASGGAFGAMVRHLVSGWTLRILGPGWPYGTFLINVTGGLLMGVLAGWLAYRSGGGQAWRLLLGTGALGGFTTFSAFSLEAVLMIERRQWAAAALYVVGSVTLAIGAVFVGLWLSRRVFS